MTTFVFLNPTFLPNIGGAENSILEMSLAAQKIGFRSIIITSDANKIDNNKLLKKEKLSDLIDIYRFNSKKKLFSYLNCINILRKIKKNNTSRFIIISRNHIMSLCAKAAGFKTVNYLVPSVIYYQNKNNFDILNPKETLRNSSHILFQCIAFWLTKTYAFSNIIADQIYNASLKIKKPGYLTPGINRDKFFEISISKKEALRDKYKVPKDATILLGIGRFVEQKQFHLAIESLKFLNINYYLILVGAGPENKKYLDLIKKYDLFNRVKIFPATKDTAPYYQIADIFLMTSRYETFGQVILEALSSKLDIVAFQHGKDIQTAVKDIFYGYENLISYANNCNSKELAIAIEEMKNKNCEIKNEYREKLLKKYSWTKILETFNEI